MSDFDSFKYCLVNSDDISKVVWEKVHQESASTVIFTNDDSEFLVSYEGSKPRFLYGIDVHTHAQVREMTKDPSGRLYKAISI